MPADRRPTKNFEFKSHFIEKASHIYLFVIFTVFSINVKIFIWCSQECYANSNIKCQAW